jgi:secretory carrier-associated membrane protein
MSMLRPWSIPVLIQSSVFPLIYHSIKDEIPENHQETVTRLFQLWLVLGVTLIVNFVAVLLVVLAGEGDGARDLSGAITYAVKTVICVYY